MLSPLRNDDFWLHLKTGEYILANLSIPSHDIFLNTPTSIPWIIHSWLSTVLFELINVRAGLKAIIILKAICVFMGFVLIFLMCRKFTCNTVLSVITCAIIFIITSQSINICKPIFFSYLLFPLFYLLLEGYYDTRRKPYLYILPLIMVIWANLHGGFITGILLVCSFSIGKAIDVYVQNKTWRIKGSIRRVAVSTALCVIASFLTPYTYHVYTYMFNFAYPTEYIIRCPEWLPIVIGQSGLYLIYISVVGFIAIIAIRYIRFSILFPFVLFTCMALLKSHFIFYSVVSAGYLLCSVFPHFMQRIAPVRAKIPSSLRSTVHYGVYIALIAVLGYTVHGLQRRGLLFRPEIDRTAYPYGAVKFLDKYNPEGKLLNYREWGGFLAYHLYPKYQIFIDGRITESAGEITRSYETIAQARSGFEDTLKLLDIDIVVADYSAFRRSSSDPIQPIAYRPDWRIVYWDDNSIIYLRNTAKNADLIAQHEYQIVVPATTSKPFRTRELDIALDECKRAIEMFPSEKAYIYMGFLQKNNADIEKALESFKNALAINPLSVQALQNIGVIYMEQNKFDEAVSFFKKALSIDPAYQNALECLNLISKK